METKIIDSDSETDSENNNESDNENENDNKIENKAKAEKYLREVNMAIMALPNLNLTHEERNKVELAIRSGKSSPEILELVRKATSTSKLTSKLTSKSLEHNKVEIINRKQKNDSILSYLQNILFVIVVIFAIYLFYDENIINFISFKQ